MQGVPRRRLEAPSVATLTDPHPGYVTVADLQSIYGLTRNRVYYLAMTHGWRRYTIDGQVRYHWDDVAEVLNQGESAGQLDNDGTA